VEGVWLGKLGAVVSSTLRTLAFGFSRVTATFVCYKAGFCWPKKKASQDLKNGGKPQWVAMKSTKQHAQ
jgi:hypothetical protein